MAGIDELIATFMGQADTALNAGPAPWQQELLETVNPEKVKRQNIARALAKASTAMATTPGNFLAGISTAAATGADSYLTGRDEAEQQRMKVQQLIGMQEQKDQDRRLGLLMDAIGVQRNQISDKREGEKHETGLERDRAYTDYYRRRGTDGEDGLNANQKRNAKQSIINAIDRLERRLRDDRSNEYLDDESLIQQRLLEEQDRLERIFGVRLLDDNPVESVSPQVGGTPAPNVSQADLFAPRPGATGGEQVLTPEQYEPQQTGITTGPGGIREGATATNPQTGQRVIYRNGQWQPL